MFYSRSIKIFQIEFYDTFHVGFMKCSIFILTYT